MKVSLEEMLSNSSGTVEVLETAPRFRAPLLVTTVPSLTHGR